MGLKIYIADDEKNIRELIKTFLSREGYDVTCFDNGDNLLKEFKQTPADLVILDIMMPGTDGLEICSQIRQNSKVPIIIVSAKDSAVDRINGINIGSDDYMVKPFLPLELVARVKALFRRSQLNEDTAMSESNIVIPNDSRISYGDIILDYSARKAIADEANQSFSLTPTEFEFMEFMIKNGDRAVKRDELMKQIWNYEDDSIDTRATDDLVKRLRKKLKANNVKVKIETVWGYGFRLSKVNDN